MGYNATVVVMVDALDEIADDPEFGKKLAAKIREVGAYQDHDKFHYGMGDVVAGNHANAATVIETHHADMSAYVRVGQNYGHVLKRDFDADGIKLIEPAKPSKV